MDNCVEDCILEGEGEAQLEGQADFCAAIALYRTSCLVLSGNPGPKPRSRRRCVVNASLFRTLNSAVDGNDHEHIQLSEYSLESTAEWREGPRVRELDCWKRGL
jgi:hypothetical protein